ncbi:MAG: cytochrome c peroxidase [Tepidisphaeraceae bacterium]
MAANHLIGRLATKGLLAVAVIGGALATAWLPAFAEPPAAPTTESSLRDLYSGPVEGWPAAHWMEGVEHRELGVLPKVKHPENNPYTDAKADLGKQLFFDPRLSSSNGVACVSCHHPDLAWADGKTAAQGHHLQTGSRNSPSLMNAAFRTQLMWDGRAASLEDQVLLPLSNDKEMHADFGDVEKRLNTIPGYKKQFAAVFGDDKPITLERVTMAIACFERTIVGGRSRFDQFLKGKPDALTDQELRGLHLFRTAANCINCHSGPTMSDGKFHNLGLTYYKRQYEDLGRYNVTKNPDDIGRFLTPPLRNISRTGPYMHNGFFNLEGVVAMYNAGGPRVVATSEAEKADPLFPQKDALLKPLKLNAEDRAAIVAFLKALEEPALRVRSTQPADQ